MSLAVALQLRDRGLPAPRHTVLISPWLDISMSDPGISDLERVDPILAPAGLKVADAVYRGTLDERDSMVSPIHGDLRGLGHITMFSGTRDTLNADARRFVQLAAAAGVSSTTSKRREWCTSTHSCRCRRRRRRERRWRRC